MTSATVKQKSSVVFRPHARRAIPAWLMSAGLHAAVLVGGVLLFASDSSPKSATVRQRRAEIVLVPAKAEVERAKALRVANERGAEGGVAQASLLTAANGNQGAVDLESSLPTADQPPTLQSAQLPALMGVTVNGEQLVASPGSLGVRGQPRILPRIHEADILAEEAKRVPEAVPLGQPADLSFYGVSASGRSFVFVIDRSESMGNSRLGAIDAAAKELRTSLGTLSEQQFFQVIAYNQSATVHARRELMPASAENKQELIGFVGRLSAFGGTEHIYGLQAALKLRPEVIYLLTDGGDPVPNALQLRTIRELSAGRTQINCLHFTADRSETPATAFLKQLARDNGGTYALIVLK